MYWKPVENGPTNYKVPTFYGFLICFLLFSNILCIFIFLVFGWNFWISVSSSQVQPRLWHKGNVIRWPRHKYFCDVFSSGLLNNMQNCIQIFQNIAHLSSTVTNNFIILWLRDVVVVVLSLVLFCCSGSFILFFQCFLFQMHVLNVLSLLIQRIGDKVSITPLFFLYLPLDLENNLYIKQLVISNPWTYRFTVRLFMSNKLERCDFIVFIKVKPFAASLSQYLPELWQESGDHNMLRCAIVSTMTHLVEVSKFF